MKYVADTNILLRYVLQDNLRQFKKVNAYFQKAKSGKIEIIFLREVVIEAEYALRRIYGIPKEDIIKALIQFISIPYLTFENRIVLLESLLLYQQYNIDLIDLIVHVTAEKEHAQVLSFDQDFKKLARSKS